MTNTGIAALLLCLLTACETADVETDAPATTDAGVIGDAPGLVCEPACPGEISLCCPTDSRNMCRAILTDRINCGGCGVVCEGACTNGVCD